MMFDVFKIEIYIENVKKLIRHVVELKFRKQQLIASEVTKK